MFYRSGPNLTSNLAASATKGTWGELLCDRQAFGLTLSRVFSDSLWWFYLFWIPPFLVQARGLDLHQMGVLGWIPYFFASVGSIAGGYASGFVSIQACIVGEALAMPAKVDLIVCLIPVPEA
jgi:MFS transporter, ACS family, hexuronate transporter